MSRSLNICMFGASFLPRRGGMEFVIHHLANALVEDGHRVTVVAERTAWADIGVQRNYELARYGIPTRGLRRMGLSGPTSLLSVWRRHRQLPFDVLHCHGVSYAGSRAVRIKNLLGIPVVMTPHGEDIQRVPEIGYGLRLDPKWDVKIRENLSHADAVTAISLSVQQELDGVDPGKIIRIPNGVHVREYGGQRGRYLRERLGLADDVLLLLSVGRNHVKKGYAYGIRSIAALRDRYPLQNVHYVIVGKNVSEHAGLVSELSLQDTVTLIEELSPSEVMCCYQSADIFFSPSIIEGLSLVSIEALACGLPLLVTNVPGNEDVVRDTGAGVIVRTKDPEDMALGLYRLAADKQARDTLRAVALRCSAEYDWGVIARRYAEVYRNVAAGRPVRGTNDR